ncbi:putative secreted protein [uncultured Desulfatiglans sp.]|nr:putative secreted protein [uncultured Desulfatiglans sp.]
MKLLYIAAILASAALWFWLFQYEGAAQPGSLSTFHVEFKECELCHVPWRGVSQAQCLECHEFSDVSDMRRELRFHQAEDKCLQCHREHQGLHGSIARMDHTMLSGRLQCTDCHTDIHEGLFGSRCRECHAIETWDVPGYRHSPRERKNCHRCHKAPYSHHDKEFWKKIKSAHGMGSQDLSFPVLECWRCHVTTSWQNLLMSHPLGEGRAKPRRTRRYSLQQ